MTTMTARVRRPGSGWPDTEPVATPLTSSEQRLFMGSKAGGRNEVQQENYDNKRLENRDYKLHGPKTKRKGKGKKKRP